MNPNKNKKDIAIIGTGISGLNTVYNLLKNNVLPIASVTFYEKNPTIGGVLQSTNKNNFICEQGAQGVLLSRESFAQIVENLNLQHKICIPNKKNSIRYFIHKGKCIALSPNIFKLLFVNLISFVTLVKIFKFFILKKIKPPKFNDTLYEFVFKNFGTKAADYFLIPICFGIWGGGAKKILCRFVFPKFPLFPMPTKKAQLASFQNGMQTLPLAMWNAIENLCKQKNVSLKLQFNCNIFSILKSETHEKLNVTFTNQNKDQTENFNIVIFSGQPWQTKNINFGQTPAIISALNNILKIPTNSLTVVCLGGEKIENFQYKNGFGVLANKNSSDLLGILFVHTIYEHHAPKNNFLYRVLLGGDTNTNIHTKSDEELVKIAGNHLKKLQLLDGNENIKFQEINRYENYIPIATQYQDIFLESIWQLEALNPGLFFTGNYMHGVSVANCLEHSKSTANKIESEYIDRGES